MSNVYGITAGENKSSGNSNYHHPRVPLSDITHTFSKAHQEPTTTKEHSHTLACFMKSTTWVLDIIDITDENDPIQLVTLVRTISLIINSPPSIEKPKSCVQAL